MWWFVLELSLIIGWIWPVRKKIGGQKWKEWRFIVFHWPLSLSWQSLICNHLLSIYPHAVTLKQIYCFHYRFQSLLISSSLFTHSGLLLINSLLIPPLCSCCRMPRHLRARWWFWSAGSVEALPCRSDGTVRERRSWTPLIFVFSRKVRHSS